MDHLAIAGGNAVDDDILVAVDQPEKGLAASRHTRHRVLVQHDGLALPGNPIEGIQRDVRTRAKGHRQESKPA